MMLINRLSRYLFPRGTNNLNLINLGGLSLGMGCAMLLLLAVRYEFSYDSFYENRNLIYQILVEGEKTDGTIERTPSVEYRAAGELTRAFLSSPELSADSAEYSARVANTLMKDFSSVTGNTERGSSYLTNISRLAPQAGVMHSGERTRAENHFYFVEPAILKLFGFSFVAGDGDTALARPGSVLVTEKMAGEYFGEANPIGKKLTFATAGHSFSLRVTGVLRSMPANSSLQINFLAFYPFEEIAATVHPAPLYTYTFIEFGRVKRTSASMLGMIMQDLVLWTRPVHVEAAARSFADELVHCAYIDPHAEHSYKRYRLTTRPFSSLHFAEDRSFYGIGGETGEPIIRGNRFAVILLLCLAILILIISCINVVNLATANSAGRMREIAIRKIMGADRRRLLFQFLRESTILSILSLPVALSLVELLTPLLDISYLGTPLSTFQNYFSLWILFSCLVLATGILSGIYPAFFISSLAPVQGIHDDTLPAVRRVRKGLIIFQLSISVFIFIFALFLLRQEIAVQEMVHSSSVAMQTESADMVKQVGIARLPVGRHWHKPILFAGVTAMFLAALGLAGFAHYETARRTKEIGIRKALGAARMQLCLDFTFRFIPIMLVANGLAWGVSIPVIPWIFRAIDYPLMVFDRLPVLMFSGSVTLLVTLFIVGLQIFRAASIAPVAALRYE